MPSKMVVDRQKSARAVIAAARTHRSLVADRFGSLMSSSVQAGETLPDVGLAVELAARSIEAATAAMVAADEAHERELGDDQGPRRARDEAGEALYGAIVELKEMAVGLLGPAALPVLGLQGTWGHWGG